MKSFGIYKETNTKNNDNDNNNLQDTKYQVYNSKNELIAVWNSQYASYCIRKGFATNLDKKLNKLMIVEKYESKLVPNPLTSNEAAKIVNIYETKEKDAKNESNSTKSNDEIESKENKKEEIRKEMESLLSEKDEKLFFKRCIKVLVHEIGHLFGLKHCVYFECIMNGSNNLDESDEKPVYLCPICLHKLYFCRLIRFYDDNNDMANDSSDSAQSKNGFEKPLDLVKRYRNLQNIYEKYQLLDEAKWFESRVELVTKKPV